MKKIRNLILLVAAGLAPAAYSATTTYTFTGGTTALSNGIANASGVAFQNSSNPAFAGAGTIAWGIFSITDSQISAAASASTLISAFSNWNGVTSTFNSAGPSGARGVFNFNAAARDLTVAGPTGGADFAGKSMYVFVGNGTSFALSNQFLVLKTTFTFNTAESGPTAFTKTLTRSNATTLIGTEVANVFTTTADTSTTPGWNTAALVPEPSAALLGAVGALGLLRRRRN
jgi:hypothetical protein